MLTREQRQQLEAEWSSDDRSIVRFVMLVRSIAAAVLVLGVVWMAGTVELDNARQAAAVSTPQSEGSALRASQQAFDERRARWEGTEAKALQQAASR